MTDLGLSLRNHLKETIVVSPLSVLRTVQDEDESTKVLFALNDGECVEGVLIPEEERLTACLSSQAGCAVNCGFCATGQIGFKRNLSAGEIVSQLILLEKLALKRVTNVVMMGMGEPLHNIPALFKAIRLLIDPDGLGISHRRLTVSTVGWVPGIRAMIEQDINVKLAISLTATTDELRRQLTPLAARFTLAELMKAMRDYSKYTKFRVSISYLLLDGINATLEDADRLIEMLKGIPCKINLMEYNEVVPSFRRTSPEVTQAFRERLLGANLTATIRASRGRGVKGACGQLAGGYADFI